MDDSEYIKTMADVMNFSRFIQGLDLLGFYERIWRAKTLGHDNPTLYREAITNLDKLKRLAEILFEAQEKINEEGL